MRKVVSTLGIGVLLVFVLFIANMYTAVGQDTTSPVVTITSPENLSAFSNDTIEIKWEGSDEDSGIREYRIKIDGGPWTNVGMETSRTYSGLTEGQHLVMVRAYDMNNNDNTDEIEFTVDLTTPRVLIDFYAEGGVNDSGNNLIIWSAFDNYTAIDHYEIKINDGDWKDMGKDTEYNLETMFNSDHDIVVKAVDKAGNEGTAEINVEAKGNFVGLDVITFLGIVVIIVSAVFLLTYYYWRIGINKEGNEIKNNRIDNAQQQAMEKALPILVSRKSTVKRKLPVLNKKDSKKKKANNKNRILRKKKE